MFDLKQYLSSGFKNVPQTVEGIREAANAIKAGSKFWGAIGQSSPVSWADSASAKLDAIAKMKPGAKDNHGVDLAKQALDEAFNWISGASQPKAASRVKKMAAKSLKDIESKIASFASNKANVLDIPTNASPKERAALEAKAKEIDADIAKWIGIGDALGVDTKAAQSLVRTDSGFIPSADVEATKAAGAVPGGPAPVVPPVSETAPVAAPVSTGPYKSSVLDSAGINYTGLTDDQVKQAEATYLAAQNDTTLQQKVINNLDITDEDIKGFLDTAKSEYSDYYKQQFSRGSEDFTKSLEFATAQREDQMKQEALQKQLDQEAQQANAAESGLATSGINQKAQARLAQQAQDIATSSRRSFEYNMTNAGRNAEDVLGSSTVAGLKLPTLGGTSVYTPAGNIKGTLQAEQVTNEQTRAADLEKLARERRTEILAGEGGVSVL